MRSILKKVLVILTFSMSLAATAYPQSHSRGPVTVRIHRVRQIDNLEAGPGRGAPDFQASITIAGESRRMPEVTGRDLDTESLWVFTNNECGGRVAITIRLFEDDSLRRGRARRDDHCDINPRRGVKDVNLTYNRLTGRITGDVSGMRGEVIRVRGEGDSNRAEIWFSVR